MIDKAITVHMVVMNEEKWIWYAIMSVIELVDQMIIFDTGSTDNTVQIINSIISNYQYGNKIIFEEKGKVTKEEFISLRQEQVNRTKTEYFLVVDGDEIWYKEGIREIIRAITLDNVEVIMTHFLCCAGDVYHYRKQERELYSFKFKNGNTLTGAITLRGLSMKIPGVKCGDIELTNDGYYDGVKYVFKYRKNKFFVCKKISNCFNCNLCWKSESRGRNICY